MLRITFLALLGGLTLAMASADVQDRLLTLVSSETAQVLLEKGFIQNTMYKQKGARPFLAPKTVLGNEALSFWEGDEAPFFVENLYLYKKPATEITRDEPDALRISRILRSVSSLEGIEYYSTSRKRMRTLYEKSFAIASPDSRLKIPDALSGPANNISQYVFQRDLTFGSCVYLYSYRQDADETGFFVRNLDPLSYGIIRVVNRERFKVSLIVQDLNDYLLIYALTRADFPALPGLESKVNASFSTRAEALYKWFINAYEQP